MKLSVVTRMIIGFAVLFVLICVLAWIGEQTVTHVTNQEDIVVHRLLPMTEETNQLSGILLSSSRLVGLYTNASKSPERQRLKARHDQLKNVYQSTVQSLLHNAKSYPVMAQPLRDIQPLADKVFSVADQLMDLHEKLLNNKQQVQQLHQTYLSDWAYFKDDAQSVNDSVNSSQHWLTSSLMSTGISIQRMLNKAFYENDPQKVKQELSVIHSYIKSFNSKFNQLKDNVGQASDDLAPYAQSLQSLTAPQGLLAKMKQVGIFSSEQAALFGQLNQVIDHTLSIVREAHQRLSQISAEVAKQTQANVESSRWWMVTGVVVSLILAILVGINLVQSIRDPLKRTLSHIQRMVAGDYSQQLTIKRMDEFGLISTQLNELTVQLNQIVRSIIDDASLLEKQAEDGVQACDHTRELMSTQSQKTETVANNMQLMAEQVREVSQQADASGELVTSVTEQTREGRAAIQQTLSMTTQLQEMMTDIVGQMSALQARSQDIGSIVDVIENISEQTNLLALNAAIEAARAGDHGRGFAVVADQVRHLATQTQSSTQEILQVIQTLQSQSEKSVQMIQTGQQMTQECVEQVNRNDSTLQSIAEQLNTTQQYSEQIMEQARQALAVVNDVSEHSQQIVHLSQQADHEASVQQDGSVALKDRSEQQLRRMDQFKLA
ncbi:methyl-accepting chemotaxis protein [Celerinatantimonas diazotrophica]|uniref:Methyl-accepting chemotaxis protein n=1 Tax=Celerinatantimonas diazotrophica TaxID=412034 RepID=A0A4R1JLG6_9GAMM|nr:methyl-accepting chemotaxis protein [Celerinatantimonas diazotrophica]TCK51898.1 methyl-accepting chemotaxis protein [Celerinatantimonas diazotrophica]CAG9296406.1 hypothetical protein CEDIAZO_01557 [Celerinatantimonas diazotrophica]